MKNKITIAIDAMGGDNSPDKTIQGVSLFLNKNKSNNDFFSKSYMAIKFNRKLFKKNVSTDFIRIIHTR